MHCIATDSKGNVDTTETYEGKRVQKLVFKETSRVVAGNQGAPGPAKRQGK